MTGPTSKAAPPGKRGAVLFYGAVAAATLCLVAPLWTGALPALLDYGGHQEIVDAWTRYDEVEIFRDNYIRQDSWLEPQLIPSRFVSLLYPLLDTVTGLKLFISLCLVALVGAVLFVLRVFERSRWLVLLALPFLWGTVLATGLINYLATLPMMFFAVGFARLSGSRPGWRYPLAMGGICLAAFWTHGIGYPVTCALAAGVLLVSAHRLGRLAGLATLVPSLVLFINWAKTALSKGILPESGRYVSDYWTFAMKAHALAREFDVTVDHVDAICFASIGLLWLGLLSLGRGPQASPLPEELAERLDLEGRGRWVRLGLRLRRFGYQHTLLLIAAAYAAAFTVLPMVLRDVELSKRWINVCCLFLVTLPALPRARPRSWKTKAATAALGAAFVVSIAFGIHLSLTAARFDRDELAPVLELAEHIPRGERVLCVGKSIATPRHFTATALLHDCNALIQVRRDAYVGRLASFNAVRARAKEQKRFQPQTLAPMPPSLTGKGLRWLWYWNYVIVRGDHPPLPHGVATVIRRVKGSAASWTLYRSVWGRRQQPVPPRLTKAERGALVRGNTRLAVELYAKLAGKPGNIVFSPYSVYNGLALLHAGAGGTTKAQIAKRLGISAGIDLHRALEALDVALGADAAYGHSIVLADVWLARTLRRAIVPGYVQTTLHRYGTAPRLAAFSGKRARARRRINAWITRRLSPEFKQALGPRSLGSDARAVLVTAAAMGGPWHYPIDSRETSSVAFYPPGGGSVGWPMVQLEAKLRYANRGSYELVEIPYRGRFYSAIFIVPERGRLARYEKQLTGAKLRADLAALEPRRVALRAPRFGYRSRFRLAKPLRALGITDLFETGQADLSAMVRDKLALAEAFHVATAGFDEANGEGDPHAEQGVGGNYDVALTINRPFLFLVQHRKTKTIVLLGRVQVPWAHARSRSKSARSQLQGQGQDHDLRWQPL